MNQALLEGLSDATGFVGGALLGFWIASLRIRYQRLLDRSQGLD